MIWWICPPLFPAGAPDALHRYELHTSALHRHRSADRPGHLQAGGGICQGPAAGRNHHLRRRRPGECPLSDQDRRDETGKAQSIADGFLAKQKISLQTSNAVHNSDGFNDLMNAYIADRGGFSALVDDLRR